MKLTQALQHEGKREDPQSWNKIYLNHDGKFIHAYNWSAWLLKTVVCTEELQRSRGDEKMLAAQRTATKDGGEYVMAGFPVESMGKYVPEYVALLPVPDGGGDVMVEIRLPDALAGLDGAAMKAAYEAWYAECPVREQKPKGGRQVPTAVQMAAGRAGLFCIMTQVLSYPIEAKSPVENAEFIASLKQQLTALL